MYLIRTADHTFQFPSGFAVAEIFPLDHVETIDFNIKVKCPHICKINVVVRVLMVLISTILAIFQPTVAELARVELLQLLLCCDVLHLLLGEEDVLLVELLHVQEVTLLLAVVYPDLGFLL